MAGPLPFRTRWCWPLWLVLLVGLGPLSCTKNDRPLFPVHGQLFFEGEPLPRAVVVFHPLSDPSAEKPRAVVEADGSFKVFTYTAGDGAPAGEYAVSVIAKKTTTAPVRGSGSAKAGRVRLPARYQDPATSGLRVQVLEGSNELAPIYLTR